ncbi:hypothetical protein HRbin36_02219 [bacterium HR36]|nr:hypothetical protein HRbin36_02219 [bacterium HR36]
MPHRLVSCLIVGLWLGTMGILLLQEWQQRWLAPPALPQTISDTSDDPVEWRVFRSGLGPDGAWEEPVPIGVMVSQLQREQQGGYLSMVHQLELDIGQLWYHWPVPESASQLRLESRLEMGLFGEVQRLRIVGGWSSWSRWLLVLDVSPRPDAQAFVRLMLNLPAGLWRQEYTVPWSIQAVPVNSLGPPDRLPGLRPGQRWDLPSVDVLNWANAPGQMASGLVQPQAVSLDWHGHVLSCLVVQVHRPGLQVFWWVAQDSPMRDRVLQQMVQWSNTKLILVRQPSVSRRDLLTPPAWFYRMP